MLMIIAGCLSFKFLLFYLTLKIKELKEKSKLWPAKSRSRSRERQDKEKGKDKDKEKKDNVMQASHHQIGSACTFHMMSTW